MKILAEQSPLVMQVLGEQKIDAACKYRPIRFLRTMKCDEGLLVYNIFTTTFIIIYNDEIPVFEGKVDPTTHPVGQELIKSWMLVPEDNDDRKLCMQLSDTMLMMNRAMVGVPYRSFTILPTTDCNARCFYCFELGGNRKWMSEQTAHDTADFIDRKKASDRISLRWFGGEPLYNSKAIDIICEDLTQKGIKYTATMITNGYLFDEEMVKKAKDLWKIKWVQITLDGTEEIYNRIKAYIYKGENAFQRVMRNIKLLLDAGIGVHIRMNMDDHNEKDLFKLTDELLERFGKYEGFLMYVHLLFEDSCARIAARADEDRHALIDAQMRLAAKISKSGHADYVTFMPRTRRSHCMCDSDECTMILPEGQLGKCQHFTEDHFYGNIYSDEIDIDVINELKDVSVIDEKRCYGCELLPMCISLKACLIIPRRCDVYDKRSKEHFIDAQMSNTYKKAKSKGEI